MKKLLALLLLVIIPMALAAHSGRTDSNGGHNGPNGYHYHNSGTKSSSKATSSGSGSGVATEYITKEDEIKELQTLLKEFGFYEGQITGKNDDPTIKASNKAREHYKMPGGEYYTLVRRDLLIKLREIKNKP